MIRTALIIAGFGLAFGLGMLMRRETPKPLENKSDEKPAAPPETAVRKPVDPKLLEKAQGRQITIPSPTAEEALAAQTGKKLEARSFSDLSPEQAAILQKALEQLQDPNVSEADALKILQLATANYGPQVVEIAAAALKHPAEEVRIQALKLLQRNGEPAILEVAKQALQDPAKNVRLSALTALEQQRGPEVEKLYKGMLNDPDPEVALATVHSASNLPPAKAASVLGEALVVAKTEPAVYAAECLMGLHTKEATTALLKGIKSPDEEVRAMSEHAFFTLAMDLPENPEKWWQEHQHEFDQEMVPIIDGQPNEPVPVDLLPKLPDTASPPPAAK